MKALCPALLLCPLAALGLGGARAKPAPGPFARLALVETQASVGREGTWERAAEGTGIEIGQEVRVASGSVARLELPWMSFVLGPGAHLRFAEGRLLSASLEEGRLFIEAPGRETLTVRAGRTEVRGRGLAVVRRERRAAFVSCLAGRFHVSAPGGTATLAAGQGTVVADEAAPGVTALPPPPEELLPAADPVYVQAGASVELRWRGGAPRYHVELLPAGSEVVLSQHDVEGSTLRLTVPWAGAIRWRVSARDHSGLEGPPSAEGLIAVE